MLLPKWPFPESACKQLAFRETVDFAVKIAPIFLTASRVSQRPA
jgi:hypothetical protein